MKRHMKRLSCCVLAVLFFLCSFAGTLCDAVSLSASAADIAPRYVLDDSGVYVLADKSRNIGSTKGSDKKSASSGSTKGSVKKSASGGEEKDKVTMMFAGDIMCLSAQQHVGVAGDCWDFRYSFEKVRKIFAESDLAVANLETLVSSSNPYTGTQKNAANGAPQCNAPASILAAARYAGIDALMTANNHCCDWGRVGIEETLDMLNLFRFMHTGTQYDNISEARSGAVAVSQSSDSKKSQVSDRFILVDVCGIRVALISTTHLINQRGMIDQSDLDEMVNCFDINRLKTDILDARLHGAELVIVYAHWGSENVTDIRPYQTDDARAIAEAGADLVIGSHPHCLQKYEDIETTDGRTVRVYYSLGNFLSSMARDINNDTVILKVVAERGADGRVVLSDMELIPCWVTYGTFIITPIDDEGAAASSTLRESRERIRTVFME